MILINLLPEHLIPQKRTPLPYILSVIGLAAVLAVLFSLWNEKRAEASDFRGRIAEQQAEKQRLQPFVDRYREVQAKIKTLDDKAATIQDIVSDRIVWSKQLYLLDRLKPDNMWYSRIRVTDKQRRESVPDIDPKTQKQKIGPNGEPAYKQAIVKRPMLEVIGYVVTTEDEYIDIGPITVATSQDPEFSEQFRFDNADFEDMTFKDVPVRQFTLLFDIVKSKPAEEAREEGGEEASDDAPEADEGAEAAEDAPAPAPAQPEETE